MKIGQRIILSFFVIILLVIIVLQIIIHNQKNLVKQYVINDAQHVETVWRTGQNSKVRSLAMALELIINDDVLKGIYLERNKKKLDEYSQPLFKVLRDQYQIDTVKFILPDGHCFLRMHRQNVYGDLVVLPSSLQDKTARDIVSGITIANDNLIYRAYKPYFHNKTLIGYLEIGQYLNSVINDMQYFAGAKTVLCVNKILINERNAQDIKTLDNKLGGIVKFKKFVVVTSTLEKEYALLLDNELEKTIEAASSGLQVISKILHANDQQFAFCAFPLIDIDGQNIGAVLSFLDITPYLRILNKAKTFSLSMIILLCVIVSIIGLRLMSSIIFPLVKLTQTIDQISKGNLDVLFESQTQDEIGILGQSFNNMVKVLKTTTTSIAKLNQEIAERKKIEKILQDETDRAKRYFDITGTMFVALSIKGEITLVNKKSCEILEQTEQEIIGKNWFENFVPNKDEAIKKFNQLLSGEIQSKKYYENDIKTAAGSIRHISWQTSLLRDNTGMIIGIFSSGQDITERMETEQSLKASEENYKNLTQELVQGQEATLNILEDLQEAKGTLEISRQNFLNIVEKSTDSILIVDDKGIVKFANTSATILFGRLLAEIIERPLGLDIIKQGVHETIITYPDGTEKIAAMRAVDTEWEEKTMTLVMLHDMTERKNAENSLRVAAHEWRVTFDSIGYGLSLLDLEGKIVRCNKSQSNFVNKPYAEIIGQDCHELIHDNEAEGLCPIYNTLKTKQRSILVIQKMDKWLSLSVDPLLNEENELIGLVHSVVDLTDQKIIEQKLREYTNYVENIIETAQAIIIGLDKNLNIQSINSFAENLLGKNREVIIGHSWLDLLIPEDYRDELIQVLSNCLEGSRVKGYEIPIINKDNKENMISWDSAELRDAEGQITGIVVMGYDISQRKEVEKVQRLAQLGTLVSHMAHEVNNPLMVISGRAQLSLMEEIESQEVKANLEIVMKECQRAKEIIQRLLRFSRPSKGELKPTDVNASIEELVGLIEHQFGLNNVRIKKDYASDLPLLLVDEKQIHEVFMNLLTNAQDAIGTEGTISIKTKKEGKFIKITFTDSGDGISKEVLDKIFDPFFTTKKKGTGLGLSICYSIIKAHNGNLSFESAPGRGTTAVIILPYMQENRDV